MNLINNWTSDILAISFLKHKLAYKNENCQSQVFKRNAVVCTFAKAKKCLHRNIEIFNMDFSSLQLIQPEKLWISSGG